MLSGGIKDGDINVLGFNVKSEVRRQYGFFMSAQAAGPFCVRGRYAEVQEKRHYGSGRCRLTARPLSIDAA